MDENEKFDATDELVTPMTAPEIEAEEKTEGIRTMLELASVNYEDMSDMERRYYISGLRVKCKELDEISKKAFAENRKLRERREKELGIIADTLTFIKSTVGNSLGSISLAIKNVESEVKRNGN